MSLLYTQEHLTCIHYQHKDPLIRFFTYKKGELLTITTQSQSKLLFMNKGKITVSYHSFLDKEVKHGEVCLLPMNDKFKIQVHEDSSVMIFTFDIQILMCENFSTVQLYPFIKNKPYEFSVLTLNKPLQDYLNLLEIYITDSINCIHLYHLKKQEMFYIMRAYYSKEILAKFFHPLLNREDLNFKKFVLENCLTAKNVQELASMANYSTSGFIKKFERCFEDSPYRWISQYKADKILQEINRGEKSFKDICSEYNFSSMPHFIEFCKKQYGTTPGKMRKTEEKTVEG